MRNSQNFEQVKQYVLRRLEKELSPGLYYHNFGHTAEIVVPAAEMIAKGENVKNGDLELLLIGTLFHDLGFVEVRVGHEAVSLRIATEVLPGLGYTESQLKIVQGIIKATMLPQSPTNLLEQIMADADLDMLGRDDFMLLNNNLRRELAFFGQDFTDTQWFSGQLKFVESHVYFTATARMIRNGGQERSINDLKKKLEESTLIT